MKIVHELENIDFKEAGSMKNVFEMVSESKTDYQIENMISISGVSDDLTIKIVNVELGFEIISQEQPLVKIVIYFPEKKYSLEFIKQEKDFKVEFLYQILHEKEYFNLVIFDQYQKIISSSTYVFDENIIMAYPIMEKDFSPIFAHSTVHKEDDGIVFETRIIDEAGTDKQDDKQIISHTWQNLGQHMVLSPIRVRNSEGLYQSRLNFDKMCSGIWMLIATDQKGKLISQFVLAV